MWCDLWTGTSLIQQIASCQCLLCFDCSRSLHKKRAKGLVDHVICTGKEMGPLPHLLSEVVWGASMTFQCKFKWYVRVWSGRISMQNLLDVSGMVFKASRWWRLQKGTCYGACFCFCFFFLPRLPSSCSLQLKSIKGNLQDRKLQFDHTAWDALCSSPSASSISAWALHNYTRGSHSLTSFSASWSQTFYLFVNEKSQAAKPTKPLDSIIYLAFFFLLWHQPMGNLSHPVWAFGWGHRRLSVGPKTCLLGATFLPVLSKPGASPNGNLSMLKGTLQDLGAGNPLMKMEEAWCWVFFRGTIGPLHMLWRTGNLQRLCSALLNCINSII